MCQYPVSPATQLSMYRETTQRQLCMRIGCHANTTNSQQINILRRQISRRFSGGLVGSSLLERSGRGRGVLAAARGGAFWGRSGAIKPLTLFLRKDLTFKRESFKVSSVRSRLTGQDLRHQERGPRTVRGHVAANSKKRHREPSRGWDTGPRHVAHSA